MQCINRFTLQIIKKNQLATINSFNTSDRYFYGKCIKYHILFISYCCMSIIGVKCVTMILDVAWRKV